MVRGKAQGDREFKSVLDELEGFAKELKDTNERDLGAKLSPMIAISESQKGEIQ